MFEPYPDLVQTYTLELPTGEGIHFDQTLWGKVIAVRMLCLSGGRYHLDDTVATSRLRQLLEASSFGGEWAFEASDPRFDELRREVRLLIRELFGAEP